MNSKLLLHHETQPVPCAIYGMGKAGRSLFLSLRKYRIPVTSFFMRHPKKLQLFAKKKSCGFIPIFSDIASYVEHLQKTKTIILFLSVPDDAILEVANSLKHHFFLPPCIAHLSGSHSYDVISCLANRSSLSQFHPLASLSGQSPIPLGTLNTICANDPQIEQILFNLSRKIKLSPSSIKNGMQSFYHVAASISGNLPVALVADSICLMKHAGIDEDLARKGLARLLRSTAKTIEKKSLMKALTGPIARGDIGTVKQHLQTLQQLNHNKTECIYRLLSSKLIELSDNQEKKIQFQKLLDKTSI